jgi:hypothetical protein
MSEGASDLPPTLLPLEPPTPRTASPSGLPAEPQLIAGETWRSPVQMFFEYSAASFGL